MTFDIDNIPLIKNIYVKRKAIGPRADEPQVQ